mmetsp:Transcript_24573/g.85417  ORF Transcript_24573/g.85417 Transcript_24573/m.85417 type:complete len:608 (-) Transcript_24573:69-1892(-)
MAVAQVAAWGGVWGGAGRGASSGDAGGEAGDSFGIDTARVRADGGDLARTASTTSDGHYVLGDAEPRGRRRSRSRSRGRSPGGGDRRRRQRRRLSPSASNTRRRDGRDRDADRPRSRTRSPSASMSRSRGLDRRERRRGGGGSRSRSRSLSPSLASSSSAASSSVSSAVTSPSRPATRRAASDVDWGSRNRYRAEDGGDGPRRSLSPTRLAGAGAATWPSDPRSPRSQPAATVLARAEAAGAPWATAVHRASMSDEDIERALDEMVEGSAAARDAESGAGAGAGAAAAATSSTATPWPSFLTRRRAEAARRMSYEFHGRRSAHDGRRRGGEASREHTSRWLAGHPRADRRSREYLSALERSSAAGSGYAGPWPLDHRAAAAAAAATHPHIRSDGDIGRAIGWQAPTAAWLAAPAPASVEARGENSMSSYLQTIPDVDVPPSPPSPPTSETRPPPSPTDAPATSDGAALLEAVRCEACGEVAVDACVRGEEHRVFCGDGCGRDGDGHVGAAARGRRLPPMVARLLASVVVECPHGCGLRFAGNVVAAHARSHCAARAGGGTDGGRCGDEDAAASSTTSPRCGEGAGAGAGAAMMAAADAAASHGTSVM